MREGMDCGEKERTPSVFQPRACSEEQLARIAVTRSAFELNHDTLMQAAKHNRYRSLAITALEEAAMWTVKAISHEEG